MATLNGIRKGCTRELNVQDLGNLNTSKLNSGSEKACVDSTQTMLNNIPKWMLSENSRETFATQLCRSALVFREWPRAEIYLLVADSAESKFSSVLSFLPSPQSLYWEVWIEPIYVKAAFQDWRKTHEEFASSWSDQDLIDFNKALGNKIILPPLFIKEGDPLSPVRICFPTPEASKLLEPNLTGVTENPDLTEGAHL